MHNMFSQVVKKVEGMESTYFMKADILLEMHELFCVAPM